MSQGNFLPKIFACYGGIFYFPGYYVFEGATFSSHGSLENITGFNGIYKHTNIVIS